MHVVPLYVYVFVGVAVVSVVFAASSYLKVLRMKRHRQWREYLVAALCEPLSHAPAVASVGKDESGEFYTTLCYGKLMTDALVVGLHAKGTFTRLIATIEGHLLVDLSQRKIDVAGRIPPVFLPAGTHISVTLEGTGALDLIGYEVPSHIREDVREIVTALSERMSPAAEVTHARTLS